MASRDFIGRGWRFPFRFDPRSGGVAKDQGDGVNQKLNRIRQSLFLIIGVRKGELYFSRRFGSRMRTLIFSLNTANLAQRIKFEVFAAFEDRDFGEHRAFIEKISIILPDRVRGLASADVSVNFVLRNTNAESNLVFPFYLTGPARTAAERGSSE